MKITISKILNRTDLAESGSHGGLVITKNIKEPMKDFFEIPGKDQEFQDKLDGDIFPIHYAVYTDNGTTPNDRVTPIGRYASKHKLKPGDNLVFNKIMSGSTPNYLIEYVRKLSSIYFVGRSREKVEVLDFDHFTSVILQNVSEGKIKRVSPTVCEMEAKYLGKIGTLMICQNGSSYEMYFDDEHIEENNKYFELDTVKHPFELKKMETWNLSISIDDESDELDDLADAEYISGVAQNNISSESIQYIASPEEKKDKQLVAGKYVANRDRSTANKALARARYSCEYDETHELFLRKTQPINYTEPHHLIPLKYDSLFEKSLDVQANIVSLCSHCHNLIHYGADAEIVIRKLWADREEEIKAAGIGKMIKGSVLNINILLEFYGIK